MKKYTIIIGLLLVFLVIATGCNKNNNQTTPTPTATQTPTATPTPTPDATGNAILDLKAEPPQKTQFTKFGEQPQTFTN